MKQTHCWRLCFHFRQSYPPTLSQWHILYVFFTRFRFLPQVTSPRKRARQNQTRKRHHSPWSLSILNSGANGKKLLKRRSCCWWRRRATASEVKPEPTDRQTHKHSLDGKSSGVEWKSVPPSIDVFPLPPALERVQTHSDTRVSPSSWNPHNYLLPLDRSQAASSS